MAITFSSDTAWEQLTTEGEVITARARPRKRTANDGTVQRTWCNRGRGEPKEFDVRVQYRETVDPLDPEEIGNYVGLSGFADLEAWQAEMENLNDELPPFVHLYHVTPVNAAFEAGIVGEGADDR